MNKKFLFIPLAALLVAGGLSLAADSETQGRVKEKQSSIVLPSPAPTPPTVLKPTNPPPTYQDSGLSNDNYYTNVDGDSIHSPAYSDTVPAGATAQCRDGTYSFSQNRQGTCSHHGGVAEWL